MVLQKRVQSHVLEKIIATMMVFFAIVAVVIMFKALPIPNPDSNLAVIELLLIILIAMLGQTLVLIKIFEQHI